MLSRFDTAASLAFFLCLIASTTTAQSINSDYDWSFQVDSSIQAGKLTTITVSSCPAGVRGDEPHYWLYLIGVSVSEAVLVSGGSCKGDGRSGSLSFTPKYDYDHLYTVASASNGLQEQVIAARFTPSNPTGVPQSGTVRLAAREYRLHAPVSFRSSFQTIDMAGAIIECQVDDVCLYIGDPGNSTLFSDISVVNPRGRPMVKNGTHPFIEVNAQKTRIINLGLRRPPSGATFGTLLQVDDDQAFLLDGMEGSTGIRCDPEFCGAYVTAPGPFNKNSAVGWLENLNISPQCVGNGVLWQSGNTLRISNSVIEGYAQYGVVTGTPRGGYGGTRLENVYMEAGNCQNPFFHKAYSAGVIVNGNKLVIHGGEGPQGVSPCFTGTSCSGTTTDLRYWVVANKVGTGASNPLYLGRADARSGSKISISWPRIPTASSYDLLASVAHSQTVDAPYGSGNYAVAVGIFAANCSSVTCTYTDAQKPRLAYTVSIPTYYPRLDFWPGDVVLAGSGAESHIWSAATLEIDHEVGIINNELGRRAPAVFSANCGSSAIGVPLWVTCLGSSLPPEMWYEQGATIVAVKPQFDGGKATNLKGRFNFSSLGSGPGHIITLSDSNFEKTVAHHFNRPGNDPADAFIGYDNISSDPSQVSISFGAPKAISEYISNVGDGNHWLERLTASLKSFRVPVSLPRLEGITDTDTVKNLNAEMLNGKKSVDFVPYTTSSTCDRAHGGMFNYVSGEAGVKDTVRVCAKAGNGTWSWRVLF